MFLKRGTAVCCALMLVLIVFLGGAVAAQPPTTPAQEGFVPVKDLPNREELPAAPLVMSAYAVAWLAVFGYLWSIWSRMGRVERDIAEVRRRIDAANRR